MNSMKTRAIAVGFVLVASASLVAQRGGGAGGGGAQNARAAAPVDLTGTWISIVTEDWRYRMVTPAHLVAGRHDVED